MLLQSVSTKAIASSSRQQVGSLQTQLAKLQQEQASGQKYDVAGALGPRTQRLIDMRDSYARAEEYLVLDETLASRLEVMQNVLTAVGSKVEDLFGAALTGNSSALSAELVQANASELLSTMFGSLNSTLGGRYLFAGTAVETAPAQEPGTVNPATGEAPLQVIQQVIAAKPPLNTIADLDDLMSGADGIDAVFDDTHSNAAFHFGSTFYNGSTSDVSGKVDTAQSVTYGVRFDDPAVKQVLKAAYILASVDPSTAGPGVYQTVLERSYGMLSQGLVALRARQAELGLHEQTVENAKERLNAQIEVLNRQIYSLEAADPYETGVRLNSLVNQMETTFSITARLSQLSLINYL